MIGSLVFCCLLAILGITVAFRLKEMVDLATMRNKLFWLQDLEFVPISYYIKNYQTKARFYMDEIK